MRAKKNPHACFSLSYVTDFSSGVFKFRARFSLTAAELRWINHDHANKDGVEKMVRGSYEYYI
jgi:hypothetical protein